LTAAVCCQTRRGLGFLSSAAMLRRTVFHLASLLIAWY
jgi:hypothetical protein